MTDNYYEVLNIASSSTETEVKRAYVLQIRKFPVEKHPEKFNQIRTAYNTLKVKESRREYDTMLLYGDEIKQLQDQGMEAYEDEEYEKACDFFKKILIIEPSLSEVRNFYALSLLYIGEEDKAIHQFKRLMVIEPENSTYQMNYAKALEENDQFDEAMLQYKRMYLINPANMDALFGLIDLYVSQQHLPKAMIFLDKSIKSQKETGFVLFYYLMKRMDLTIKLKDEQELEKTLEQIAQHAKGYPEEQDRVHSELMDVGLQLYKEKLYRFSLIIFKFLAPYRQKQAEFLELLAETEKRAAVYSEYDRMADEGQVIKSVRNILLVYLFGDDFTEEEFDQYSERAFEDIYHDSKFSPEATLKSIKLLRNKYPALYECRSEVFENYSRLSEVSLRRDEQFDLVLKDSSVALPVIKLVAFYLTYFETEQEKEAAFDEIWDELSDESAGSLKKSSQRIEKKYPDLFELNRKFFQDMQS
ncbi:J domain-containing protein [Mesobacillus harenae]|uniref:J domain-containing protein n=1 Tax=Mesobacillus harenae TaxID=2213203 RepID=UPI001580E3C5|nr:DnaJ domain-containing protein [Mesobacillus harenae]